MPPRPRPRHASSGPYCDRDLITGLCFLERLFQSNIRILERERESLKYLANPWQ